MKKMIMVMAGLIVSTSAFAAVGEDVSAHCKNVVLPQVNQLIKTHKESNAAPVDQKSKDKKASDTI